MASSIPSVRELIPIIQKRNYETATTFQLVHFRISPYLTRILLMLNISANATTLIALLIGLMSVFALVRLVNSPHLVLISALLFQLHYLFDCSDGEIARFRKTQSPAGKYADLFLHLFVYPIFFLSMGWGATNATGNPYFLLLGGISAVGALWYDHLWFDSGPDPASLTPVKMPSVTIAKRKSALTLFIERSSIVWSFPLIANVFGLVGVLVSALGSLEPLFWFLWFYGISYPLFSVFTAWRVHRNLVKTYAKRS
ncbi:CDP-alcohol phosphatidyltransferase family protein [Candidatus Berkelbacteria bacterium]|nr:CDP-alcohol phosphatidyltransferase family protein [Candidatus Berkelbacteria bacterium]